LLPNPHLLVNPYLTREAVASSRIEGTLTSLPEVFEAAAGGEARGDVREVLNYVRALNRGLDVLEQLSLSLRTIREMHRVLLEDVRGQERTPGEFRTSPNWIGSPGAPLDDALFVPPPPEHVMPCLSDLESFVHEDSPLPLLVRCGLLHYQFETIHPFLDGNGRIGRLLIVVYLIAQRALSQPLLYVSSFFERNRAAYYDTLQAVRERWAIQEWLRFFLQAVSTQAHDAVRRTERLLDLRETYRQAISRSRSHAPDVVDLLFEAPVVTAAQVAARLGMSQQGAKYLLESMERDGIVTELGPGPRRRRRWGSMDVMRVLQSEEAT
jgi:Fic family protein